MTDCVSIVGDIITWYDMDKAIKEFVLPPPPPPAKLDELPTLTAYLRNYGQSLAKKAIKSLRPLHVPNKDPLPDFDDYPDDRVPLDAQQHVAAAAIKALDKHGATFMIGEPGCIAGESEIYDPVAGIYRRVDQITEPFHVISRHEGKVVIGKAHVPVTKYLTPLYRVTLSNGQSFVAAGHHEILTENGWSHVSTIAEEMQGSALVLLPSIAEPCLQESPRDASRSSRRPSGSPGDCPTGRHSRGEPPQSEADSGQESARRQVDALGHSPVYSHADGLGCAPERTHAYPAYVLPSKPGSTNLGSYNPGVVSEFCSSSESCGQSETHSPDDPQSSEESRPPRNTLESVQRSTLYSPSGESGEKVSITRIEYERSDVFYDFTVDVYHNYVMAGVVHHNCGKTITSIATVHEHAKRPRSKGGYAGKYRAIVLCPDSLIDKWAEEIRTTVTDANVITLKKWHDILDVGEPTEIIKSHPNDPVERQSWVSTITDEKAFKAACKAGDYELARTFVSAELVTSKVETSADQCRKRWKRPWPAEWLVLGRDQVKRGFKLNGLGSKRRCFDKELRENFPHKLVEVDRVDVIGPDGKRVYKPGSYQAVQKGVYEKRLVCPRCGKIPTDEKGRVLSTKALTGTATWCTGKIMREVTKVGYGNDVIYEAQNHVKYKGIAEETFPYYIRRMKVGSRFNHAGKSWILEECGEPLWQCVRHANQWPAASLVQSRLQGWANFVIIDEAHQQKGAATAQATGMSKILSTTKHALALTGTLIGGYADHLFPLLIRLAGREMKERGFEWGKVTPFNEQYGCFDRIVTGNIPVTTTTRSGSSNSLAKKVGKMEDRREVKPGIMPTLFSHLMMKRSMFIRLEQFLDCLPGFAEKMIACELDVDIQEEYNRVAHQLEAANNAMLALGNMKLLGTTLWTLLSYPDCPFDWQPRFEGDHAVGWWRQPKLYKKENFVGITTPANFDTDRILPKERKIIDLCKENASKGEQTWVYTLLKDVHSPVAHLMSALEAEGLRVGNLKSKDCTPRDRIKYINKVGPTVDVMISHPCLVATGMELFGKAEGSHNFNHLVFFQTGYDLFTLRQASRRAWRIGQTRDCTVHYMYYLGTMQAAAMQLMSRKMLAAQQLEEGSISEEGLAAMGGSSDTAALINAISNVIDPADIERNWGKTSGGTGRKKLKQIVAVEKDDDDELDTPVQAEVFATDADDWDDDEEEENADEFEAEQAPVLPKSEPKSKPVVEDDDDEFEDDDDDMDFDDSDLAEMFAKLKAGTESDDLAW